MYIYERVVVVIFNLSTKVAPPRRTAMANPRVGATLAERLKILTGLRHPEGRNFGRKVENSDRVAPPGRAQLWLKG